MRKSIIFFLFFLLSILNLVYSQDNYKAGEYLKFRVHYAGLDAGFATLEVKNTTLNGESYYHIIGKGNSSGFVRTFFKVEDLYESYVNVSTKLPLQLIRNVHEGRYIRNEIYHFDHVNKKAKVENKINGKIVVESIPIDAHDLLSAFYNLRNSDYRKLKIGDFINQNIFLGDEVLSFKLKILGREIIKTKFGKIKSLKIRPYVQSGRIFKESGSLTMWISDDENLVPLKIKAGLLVGSLNADLYEFSNLKYPTNFIK